MVRFVTIKNSVSGIVFNLKRVQKRFVFDHFRKWSVLGPPKTRFREYDSTQKGSKNGPILLVSLSLRDITFSRCNLVAEGHCLGSQNLVLSGKICPSVTFGMIHFWGQSSGFRDWYSTERVPKTDRFGGVRPKWSTFWNKVSEFRDWKSTGNWSKTDRFADVRPLRINVTNE